MLIIDILHVSIFDIFFLNFAHNYVYIYLAMGLPSATSWVRGQQIMKINVFNENGYPLAASKK